MAYIINGIPIKYIIYATIILLAIVFIINYIRGPKLSKKYYSDKDIENGPIKLLKKYDEKLLNNIKSVINNKYYEWSENTLNTGSIKILPIYFFGIKNNTLQNLPYLSSFINNINDIYSFIFMELAPKTHIDKNNGWGLYSNDIIRYVFCMKIYNTTIEIEGNVKELKTGEWIIYDTTKYHEIHNPGDTSSILMIIDIKRPSNIERGSNKSPDMLEVINLFSIMRDINLQ